MIHMSNGWNKSYNELNSSVNPFQRIWEIYHTTANIIKANRDIQISSGLMWIPQV